MLMCLCPYGLSNDVSASLATLPLMYMFVLKHILFIISPNPHCRVSCYSIGLKPPIYWDVPSSPAWLLYRRLFAAVAPWRSVAELSAVGCRDFERRKAAMNLKKRAAERAALDGISCLTHGECIKNVSWTCFNPENGCGRPNAKATKSEWGCYQHLPTIYGHNVRMVYYLVHHISTHQSEFQRCDMHVTCHLYLPWFPIADI